MAHPLLAHLTSEQVDYIGKEWQRLHIQHLRAHAMGKPATLTLDEWLTIIDRYSGLCAYCKKVPFEVMEHIESLSYDGGTTADNVVPACLSCNSRKGALTARRDLQTGELTLNALIQPVRKGTNPQPDELPTESPKSEQWLNPKNAAALLALSVNGVSKLVRNGTLKATWISKVNWRVSLTSCNTYLTAQQEE